MASRNKGFSHDSHRGKPMRFRKSILRVEMNARTQAEHQIAPGNPVYAKAWEEEDSLLDALKELRESVGVSSYDAIAKLSAPSLAPGKPAAAKIRSILAKGHIFSALSSDTPPESEVIYWDDGRAVAILNAFDLLGGVVAVARSSPAFAHLERMLPRNLWRNFIRSLGRVSISSLWPVSRERNRWAQRRRCHLLRLRSDQPPRYGRLAYTYQYSCCSPPSL